MGLVRVLFGFALACLAAGATLVLFVHTPAELASLPPAEASPRLTAAVLLALAAATQSAMFAAPFALIGAAFGEWRRIASARYYALLGLAIVAGGFLTQYAGRAPGAPSLLNPNALAAFLTAGLIAGLVYWAASGRYAGEPRTTEVTARPAAAASPTPPALPPYRPAFTIEHDGPDGGKTRLVAPAKLAEIDFFTVADRIGARPFKARKIGYVAARRATQMHTVDTLWNGKETINTAFPGDWIVTSLTPERDVLRDAAGNVNTYVVKAEPFARGYEPADGETELGRVFRPKSVVDALFLSGGFDILAPWGQKQTADAGYLVANNGEVYGNNAETFDATYEILAA